MMDLTDQARILERLLEFFNFRPDTRSMGGVGTLNTTSYSDLRPGSGNAFPYLDESEYDEEEDEDDISDVFAGTPEERIMQLDKFVSKINQTTMQRRNPRDPYAGKVPDRGSLGTSMLATPGMPESVQGFRKNSISPIAGLYSKGVKAGPMGTGGSAQAFRTTGPMKRTGTLGWASPSRLQPVYPEQEFDDEDIFVEIDLDNIYIKEG
tara:strand:+ start:1197 stop:1820 length:624 start_codon:yes stop_codon:yes gene_type:complete